MQVRQHDGPDALTQALSAPRIVIENPRPTVDGGAFRARGTVGQALRFEADIYADGHERLGADLLWFDADGACDRHALRETGNDRWCCEFVPLHCGLYRFGIEAWIDDWATCRSDLRKRFDAGSMTPVDVQEAIELVHAARAAVPDDAGLGALEAELSASPPELAASLLLSGTTDLTMRRTARRSFVTRLDPVFPVEIERIAAGFASWYELFPRSQDPNGRHGSFDDVIGRLPAIAAMGFDVLYMPPIHPIGRRNRKGRNNALEAGPDDPGSPYAIGSDEGGHTAIHPQLGGIEGFRRLRDAAAGYGIELALDFAIQCSPDHPWLQEHPEWFRWRLDGSLRYAENPPKKYQDIVNVDFHAPQATPALWLALRDIVEFWIGEGVKLFRVDNPHTKPLPFWEWLIADVRGRHPDAVFLSEAFTRPAMMYRLAKIGFSQSYTYFTWRDTAQQMRAYMEELTQQAPRDFFRPHFFVNTPDINPFFLQTGGRAGFLIRAALATTLSGLWGLYSGFELCDSAAVPGREEYADSEKYQLRARDWTAPGNIIGEITRLNHLRHRFRALQSHHGLRFVDCDNPQVLCYRRHMSGDGAVLLVAVSFDPFAPQDFHFDVPEQDLPASATGGIDVEELMSGQQLHWPQRRRHWRLVPDELPFAIWRLGGAS
ncbi:alpha-1,4-glucan--maltose-1-phosphate maltosyltransferase [Sinimarinibacterium flocculans]|uniref:alpha-1,4-glucan--maltose-1-phosphate maltosyltransferase n=1 Tax=Sinimarinibacterium flocculans TaxID=985250 RepID=UPI003514040A